MQKHPNKTMRDALRFLGFAEDFVLECDVVKTLMCTEDNRAKELVADALQTELLYNNDDLKIALESAMIDLETCPYLNIPRIKYQRAVDYGRFVTTGLVPCVLSSNGVSTLIRPPVATAVFDSSYSFSHFTAAQLIDNFSSTVIV